MTPEEMATHRQAGGRSGVTREVLSGYRKSPPARKTFSLGCWGGEGSWVMLGTKLPLQEMARGWTPGLLPLHLGWGTSPKERRGGGEGGG